MVPFLNSILGTMLPMLTVAKQDSMKSVFCYGKTASSLLDSSLSWDAPWGSWVWQVGVLLRACRPWEHFPPKPGRSRTPLRPPPRALGGEVAGARPFHSPAVLQ